MRFNWESKILCLCPPNILRNWWYGDKIYKRASYTSVHFFPYAKVSNTSSGALGVMGEEAEFCSINL